MGTFDSPGSLLADIPSMTGIFLRKTKKGLHSLLIWYMLALAMNWKQRLTPNILTILMTLNLDDHFLQPIYSLIASLLR